MQRSSKLSLDPNGGIWNGLGGVGYWTCLATIPVRTVSQLRDLRPCKPHPSQAFLSSAATAREVSAWRQTGCAGTRVGGANVCVPCAEGSGFVDTCPFAVRAAVYRSPTASRTTACDQPAPSSFTMARMSGLTSTRTHSHLIAAVLITEMDNASRGHAILLAT